MISLDTNLRAARMMEAGRVTVTFTSPSGQHITLTTKARAQVDGRWTGVALADAMVVFVEVPGASGEWADKVGKITKARGFVADRNADPARVWCANQLLRFLAGQPLANGLVAQEEERCGKCGRALTDPVSIARGIGPECYGQMTSSQHQAKVRPADAREAAGAEGSRLSEIVAGTVQAGPQDLPDTFRRVPGTNVEAAPGGRTRPVRRQTRAQRDALQSEAPRAVIPAHRRQQDDALHGTTWEDIFRPAAEAAGIELPR